MNKRTKNKNRKEFCLIMPLELDAMLDGEIEELQNKSFEQNGIEMKISKTDLIIGILKKHYNTGEKKNGRSDKGRDKDMHKV